MAFIYDYSGSDPLGTSELVLLRSQNIPVRNFFFSNAMFFSPHLQKIYHLLTDNHRLDPEEALLANAHL